MTGLSESVGQAVVCPGSPLFGFLSQGPTLLMGNLSAKQFSKKTVDSSPQVLPSLSAAQGVTDGLVERGCSGHMNHDKDSR